MAKIGLPKGSGKRLKVREKSVKSQGIFKWILSGNPDFSSTLQVYNCPVVRKPAFLFHILGQFNIRS